jgi:hypothetical protein
MEHLTDLFATLTIQRPSENLQFEGFDETHAHVNPFKVQHNDLYWMCQAIVLQAICLYAFQFSIYAVQRVMYGFKRSRSDPVHAQKFLLKYDVPKHEIIKDEHYYFALSWITEKFRPRWKIHPVHFTDLRWYPWKTDTSAERPFSNSPIYRKKVNDKYAAGLIPNARLIFSNLYTEIFTHCRSVIHHVKDGLTTNVPDSIQLHVKPALVEISEPEKVRTVWGVPKYFIFAEAMFFWPLFSHYFTVCKTPLLWNYESLNGGWCRLNAEYRSRFNDVFPVINSDWSEFDMRVYFSVWQDLIDAVKTYFCFCGRYCPAQPPYHDAKTDPARLERLWSWFTKGYFTMKCVSPLGHIFSRLWAGMPSGIFCTQFWDSIYNGLMIITCLHALGVDITDDFFLKLMGDDALFALVSLVPVTDLPDFMERFSEEAFRRFGSKLSAEKCKVSPSIHMAYVLGYANWNGWPIRDDVDLLAHLLHPKTMRDTPERLMARSIGIAHAAAGNKRIIRICKHIYDQLAYEGYKPTIKGLASMFDPLGIRLTPEDLMRFPSYEELIARISRPSFRSPEIQEQYWNRDHFLYEAGLAPNCI